MQLDKFLLSVFEKVGIEPTDPRVTELLTHTEINRIDVPGEIAKPVQQSLISIDTAKDNHPDVKKHYFGQIMGTIDRTLDDVYEAAGFTEDEVKEFGKEKSSTKRIRIVADALKAKAEAAATGKGQEDEDYKKRINDLNAELAKVKTTIADKEKEFQNNLVSFKKDTKLAAKLSAFKTTFDGLPEEVKVSTLKGLLSKKLQDNNADLVLDENGNFKLLLKDGTNFFDENQKPVTPDDFISKVLAENKVLQQSAAAATNGATAEPLRTNGAETNGQQKKTSLSGLYDQIKKDVTQAPVQVV